VRARDIETEREREGEREREKREREIQRVREKPVKKGGKRWTLKKTGFSQNNRFTESFELEA